MSTLVSSEKRARRDIREAYQRVMTRAWAVDDAGHSIGNSTDTALIRTAIKGVWRKLNGKPCTYPIVVSHKVRGLTRVIRHRNRLFAEWALAFNPKSGLHEVIHDVAHFIHQRQFPRDNPHCDRHLEMERMAAEYCVKRFQ